MGIASLETALLDYVADVLVNDCGRPDPAHIFRFHGALIDDCCTDTGVLSCWWEREYASDPFPGDAANATTGASIARPAVALTIRYMVCWKLPEVTANGAMILNDALYAEWDAQSAMLADVADVVTRALLRVSCGNEADEIMQNLLDETGCNCFRYFSTIPLRRADCAGVEWQVRACVKTPASVS